MDYNLSLAGKFALVTGAGKGIGRGIALSLAKAGADVLIHYRSDKNEADSLVNEISGFGVKAYSVSADIGKHEELEQMFELIEKEFGRLDVAVNNAGWDPGNVPVENVDWALYEKLTNINVRGTLFCCLNEINLMKQNKTGGTIINIGSVQQDTTVKGRTLYAMSKGAIHAMTGQLALECGQYNIRINNVAPGYIEVDRMSSQPEFNREKIAAAIPIGRLGQPEDVGAFVVYLATEGAGFITGQTLIIDGGVSRKLARSF